MRMRARLNSNFTYAEASWTQGLADWIGAHTRACDAVRIEGDLCFESVVEECPVLLV